MRARGLKLGIRRYRKETYKVAPHAGAWIETFVTGDYACDSVSRPMRARGLKLQPMLHLEMFGKSRPMRARGLKRLFRESLRNNLVVAPHAGAWIETSTFYKRLPAEHVAPHAGAWIETGVFPRSGLQRGSRPMRARGLKPVKSHSKSTALSSRPMRARGLKPMEGDFYGISAPSRPMRARGLKQLLLKVRPKCKQVAPHAGAWIETTNTCSTKPTTTVAPHAGAWIETTIQ